MKWKSSLLGGVLVVSVIPGVSLAGYQDWIGATQLQAELGASAPTGAGIDVAMVEARSDLDSNGNVNDGTATPRYLPDASLAEFAGKTIDAASGTGEISSHATTVGKYFFGNSISIAPDITQIDAYEAGSWLGGGFLQPTYGSPTQDKQPGTSPNRIANHSYVGEAGSGNLSLLQRLDWVVETDDYLQVVGVNNGGTAKPLLASAYNVISVGRTDANHALGTFDLTPTSDLYSAGRVKPDLVAPLNATSYATPVVSAASALLLETARDSSLSNGMITNRTRTINHAETSEVIKATLMAGADRITDNTSFANITDYRATAANQTENGLDRRYGAGQLNIYDSYRILTGGEQDSLEDAPLTGGVIGRFGFDYDPSFGGANGSNTLGSYLFTAESGMSELIATLAWNIDIDGGTANRFNGTPTLYDLNLALYDLTDTSLGAVAFSASVDENTENIVFDQLVFGHDYQLMVTPGSDQALFDWDYALAWQIAVPEPGTMLLLGVGALVMSRRRQAA